MRRLTEDTRDIEAPGSGRKVILKLATDFEFEVDELLYHQVNTVPKSEGMRWQDAFKMLLDRGWRAYEADQAEQEDKPLL